MRHAPSWSGAKIQTLLDMWAEKKSLQDARAGWSNTDLDVYQLRAGPPPGCPRSCRRILRVHKDVMWQHVIILKDIQRTLAYHVWEDVECQLQVENQLVPL